MLGILDTYQKSPKFRKILNISLLFIERVAWLLIGFLPNKLQEYAETLQIEIMHIPLKTNKHLFLYNFTVVELQNGVLPLLSFG